MKRSVVRCHVCNRPMSLLTLGQVAGEADGLRVQIEGLPVMECAKGHRRFVTRDFATKLIDALTRDDCRPPGRPASQGRARRDGYVCPACGREYDGGDAGHCEARRVLELNGRYAFGVCFDVPAFHCSSCGRQFVPPDEVVIDDLRKASAHALHSATGSPG